MWFHGTRDLSREAQWVKRIGNQPLEQSSVWSFWAPLASWRTRRSTAGYGFLAPFFRTLLKPLGLPVKQGFLWATRRVLGLRSRVTALVHACWPLRSNRNQSPFAVRGCCWEAFCKCQRLFFPSACYRHPPPPTPFSSPRPPLNRGPGRTSDACPWA